jgi:hypothetical protein
MMTGLSRAQATRLLGMYLRGEKVQPKPYRRRRFPQRYTREDAALLASVDEAHDTLSGPATRKILQRARYDYRERPDPRPHGQPGYLRVDTVHQGDQDGIKGVYHINAVDEVTQS